MQPTFHSGTLSSLQITISSATISISGSIQPARLPAEHKRTSKYEIILSISNHHWPDDLSHKGSFYQPIAHRKRPRYKCSNLGKPSKEMLELSNLFSFVPFLNPRVCPIKTAKAAPISHCFEHGPKDANRAW